MGELYKPGKPIRRDHKPLEHPLYRITEEARRLLQEKEGFKLVCSICGESFNSFLEAWLHQKETGHKCFRVEALIA